MGATLPQISGAGLLETGLLEGHSMMRKFAKLVRSVCAAGAIAFGITLSNPVTAPILTSQAHAQDAQVYSSNELLNVGHKFFGATSSGIFVK